MIGADLRVEHLSVSYGGVRALHDVSIAVPAGCVVALLGTNGAGKTTTLRAVSGLVRPERGTVLLDGRPVQGSAAHTVARLGVAHVPEGRGVFPSLSVADNLLAAAPLAGGIDVVAAGLEVFPELADRLDQPAGTLSGGQQQMVSLARALAVRPRLLLLDEISAGLAPALVSRLLRRVRQAVDHGCSALLVEQYVDAALEVADYYYMLASGSVVDVGEPADLERSDLAGSYLGAA